MTDANTALPGADDAAKYAALAKELELEAPLTPEPELREPQEQQQAEPQQQEQQLETVARAEHENVQKALREAREAAKASDERLRGIIQLIEQTRSQRPQPAEEKDRLKVPDVNEDPIGFFKTEVARLESQLQQAQQGGQRTTQELQAWQQQQQLHALVQRSEADILDPKSAAHKADYWDACGYLEGQRIKELDRMYPDGAAYAMQYAQQQGFRTPQDLKLAILNHDRQAVAVQALQLGLSPAQVYYDLALDRGYQAKAAQQSNGADKGKQIIEAAKRGQKAAVSVSGGSGERKGSNDMTIVDLADLFVEDPELADKMWDQMQRSGRLG